MTEVRCFIPSIKKPVERRNVLIILIIFLNSFVHQPYLPFSGRSSCLIDPWIPYSDSVFVASSTLYDVRNLARCEIST